MTITTKRSLIALLLSLVLVVSLFTVGIFADEAKDTDDAESTTVAEKEETTEKKEETSKKNDAEKKEEETTESAAVKKVKDSLIINGIIIGVIVLIGVVLIIRFRKKLGGFLSSVKSEFKRITWSSKENTRKSFLVVIVVAIAVALMLWLIDIAFNTGISELTKLFNK
jgi:preprotein translocase subunit SecE